MKVALVFPRFKYPSGDPPLGAAYLAAALRERAGVEPAIIDTTFSREPLSLLESELKKGRFDVVGISAMVTMAREAMTVARIAKQARPDTMVILGGPHATTLPELALKESALDAVCVGEGEEALARVVKEGRLEGVPGIMTRDGAGGMKGAAPELIADLDALPFPALDLLPMKDYFQSWFQLDAVAPDLRGTSVLATRGCPFKCSYCQPTLERLFGKGVRKRSPANVVDELSQRREQFNISAFLFADDTFIADRKWVKSFCAELIERGLGLKWGCNVRADLVTAELLETMKEAGLSKIYIGIEVYSDGCRRDVFNKKLTREQVETAVEAAERLKIRTQGYFMLGAPGEKREDVRNTIRYARRLRLDDATFNLTTPLPGTYLYEDHRDEVATAPEDMDYYSRYSFRGGNGLSGKWLKRRQVLAYAGFYLRPSRLLRQLGSVGTRGGARRLWSKLRRVL
jgi:radical SAM superfamily enzyme YgiQ (UPF0313 family)